MQNSRMQEEVSISFLRVKLDHSRPVAGADTAWPCWSARLSSGKKPNSRHTEPVTVTNTGRTDSTQALTA